MDEAIKSALLAFVRRVEVAAENAYWDELEGTPAERFFSGVKSASTEFLTALGEDD